MSGHKMCNPTCRAVLCCADIVQGAWRQHCCVCGGHRQWQVHCHTPAVQVSDIHAETPPYVIPSTDRLHASAHHPARCLHALTQSNVAHALQQGGQSTEELQVFVNTSCSALNSVHMRLLRLSVALPAKHSFLTLVLEAPRHTTHVCTHAARPPALPAGSLT